MRMAAGPGLRAGKSACHEPLFLLSLSGWLSMLADSKVDSMMVLILTGWPGWPCPSRLHL